MSTRDGMLNLIERLRGLCDAATDDYTLGSTTYWTDDQLQEALDRQQTVIRRERLMVEPDYGVLNALTYRDYGWRQGDVEGAESGATAWEVEDALGSAWGTSGTPGYTPNYAARSLRTSQDTAGSALYLSYRSYDLERAAADVWEQKAGHVASRFDLKTDNHDMKRSQLFTQYVQMAALHRKRAPARSIRRVRSDVNTW